MGQGMWIVDTHGRTRPVVPPGAGSPSLAAVCVPPGGGQNPLEPARLGCAIAVGPHTANFAEHVAALQAAGGLDVVEDSAALAGWVAALLRDPARRAAMAAAAEAALRHDAGLPVEGLRDVAHAAAAPGRADAPARLLARRKTARRCPGYWRRSRRSPRPRRRGGWRARDGGRRCR